MTSAYIGGPMRGIPDFNYPAFRDLAAYLRETRKWKVFSPVENDLELYPDIERCKGFKTGDLNGLPAAFSMEAVTRWDFARVIESDYTVLLPNWESSSGARSERFVAERCGRPVLLALPTDPTTRVDRRDRWTLFFEDASKPRMCAMLVDLEETVSW